MLPLVVDNVVVPRNRLWNLDNVLVPRSGLWALSDSTSTGVVLDPVPHTGSRLGDLWSS